MRSRGIVMHTIRHQIAVVRDAAEKDGHIFQTFDGDANGHLFAVLLDGREGDFDAALFRRALLVFLYPVDIFCRRTHITIGKLDVYKQGVAHHEQIAKTRGGIVRRQRPEKRDVINPPFENLGDFLLFLVGNGNCFTPSASKEKKYNYANYLHKKYSFHKYLFSKSIKISPI